MKQLRKKAGYQIIGAISFLSICAEKTYWKKKMNVIGVCLWEVELLFFSFIVSFFAPKDF